MGIYNIFWPKQRKNKKVIVAVLCLLAVVGLFVPVTPVSALDDVNLYPAVPFVGQTQRAWRELPMKNLPPNQSPEAKTYGECGCLLAALSSMVSYYFPIFGDVSIPRFPVKLDGELRPTMNWSPVYIDHLLRCGVPPQRGNNVIGFDPCLLGGDTNWGYKNVSNPCGVMPHPWALENMAIARTFSDGNGGTLHTATGVTTNHYSLDGGMNYIGANLISQRLESRQPTIVITKARSPGGAELPTDMHAYVVVGHQVTNGKGEFLVLDSSESADGGPAVPVSMLDGTYETWLKDVVGVITMAPVFAGQRHLSFIDDPAPIEFAITNPQGHRTGYNPVTRTDDRAVANAFTYTLGTEASLLGDTEGSVTAKSFQIDNPETGTWRSEIIGTGSGTYDVDVVTVNSGIPTKHLTLNGAIATGQRIKHQIKYELSAAPVVTAVDNFTPEAEPGGSRSARAGQNLIFDGKRSWDADGTVTGWSWDFGDGATGSGSRLTHAFATTGEYEVKLTVTDNLGATSTKSLQVAVTPKPVIAVERISVSSEEIQGNRSSGMPIAGEPNWRDSTSSQLDTITMSQDGRYTAFLSVASNLVANDTNVAADIFLRDRITGTTERVSVDDNEQQLPASSSSPRLSRPDGRFMAFMNGGNVYLRDRQSETTEKVNINASGQAVAGTSLMMGAVSDDGRFVAFATTASLTPEDTDGLRSVYLRDRQAGNTEWISRGQERSPYGAFESTMTSDASKVVFEAYGSAEGLQLYIKDRGDGTTKLASVRPDGTPASNASRHPSLTPDGKYLIFSNDDLDVTYLNGQNGGTGIIIKNLETGEVKGVSKSSSADNGDFLNRAALSDDGNYVLAMVVSRIPLRHGNTYESFGFGRFNRTDSTVRRVDLTQGGALPEITGGSYSALSGDSRWVAFSSYGSIFVPFDTNGVPDVFLRDMNTAVPPTADISGPYVGWARNSEFDTSITLTLDGTASADASGATLKYTWDYGDGTPVQTTTTKTTTHVYANPGTYTAKLVVDNGGEKSEPSSTTVTIQAQPTAADQMPAIPPCAQPSTEIIASGIGQIPLSTRPGWNLTNGPMPNTQSAIFSSWGSRYDYTAKPPLYQYSVRALVPFWFTGTGSIGGTSFKVPCPKASNLPPIPDAGGPYTVSANAPLTLDGSASSDPEAALLTYTWDFGDSMLGGGTRPAHTYTTPGTYYAALTVSDGEKVTKPSLGYGYAKVVVTPNQDPLTLKADVTELTAAEGSTAVITGDYSAPAGQDVTLSSSSGEVSKVPDGRWRWTDTTPDGPAERTVTISAASSGGQAADVAVKLIAANVAPSIHSIDIASIGTACANGTPVRVQTSFSDPAGDADPLTGTLEWGDGNTSALIGTTFDGLHTYAAGSYTVIVRISDDDEGSSTKTTSPQAINVRYKMGEVLPPMNTDGTSNFKMGSTIPLKVQATDCSGAAVTNLKPKVSLGLVGAADGAVNEVVSSSAADTGNTMRLSGNHYMFNFSTKKSQFSDGKDLTAGRYKLTISDPASTPTEVFFDLRP